MLIAIFFGGLFLGFLVGAIAMALFAAANCPNHGEQIS